MLCELHAVLASYHMVQLIRYIRLVNEIQFQAMMLDNDGSMEVTT